VFNHESQSNLQIDANRLLTDHFKCSERLADVAVCGELSPDSGYFRFGSSAICYGQCSSGTPSADAGAFLHDAAQHVKMDATLVRLPFDPAQVIDNFRYERYRSGSKHDGRDIKSNGIVRRLYYLVRPLMPVALRKHLQRHYFREWAKISFPSWPVDFSVENILEQLLIVAMKSHNLQRIPFIWFWPEGAPSCTVVTHDVETAAGRDFCVQLMDLNDSYGIKSAFQVVPEKRYEVPQTFLDSIAARGFEVNVHDLNHDGHLLERRDEFLRRAKHINRYGQEFGALGFRSAMLHRNLDWYHALDFSYDMSVPNVAHLDPQRGGCCTVFPFFNGKLLELPVTMTQDYTLFHILKHYSMNLWKQQTELIKNRHGLIQVIIHPDYIIDKAARAVYADLLASFSEMRARKETWIALPREVAVWWRQRSNLQLVEEGGSLRITGEGKERARIAYANLVGDRLEYEFASADQATNNFSDASSNAMEHMAI